MGNYEELAFAIVLPAIKRYKELVNMQQTEAVKNEIAELDEYMRSNSFQILAQTDPEGVECMIDGLKNGGKYCKFRPKVVNLYKGKKYRG